MCVLVGWVALLVGVWGVLCGPGVPLARCAEVRVVSGQSGGGQWPEVSRSVAFYVYVIGRSGGGGRSRGSGRGERRRSRLGAKVTQLVYLKGKRELG